VNQDVHIFGIRLLGVSEETLSKLLLTAITAATLLVIRLLLHAIARRILRSRPHKQRSFWVGQMANLLTAALFLLALLSIWFDDPARLATGIGLVSAGLAFALQKVVTSLAGYFVIMRSRVFTVGERITMGGVRGDVISLGFLKTTLMEMGDPVAGGPGVWVHGRQYTGRIVTITNDKIFEEPIFNSTREFPFIWDEIMVPITYATDRKRAEAILCAAAEKATAELQKAAAPYREAMNEQYHLDLEGLEPRVFYRITDNWLELNLRFLVADNASRSIRDQIARDVLDAFDAAGIGIASTTVDIVAFPPMRRSADKQPARP
jgi:small-conductance mechanosensitive channel